MSMIDFRLRHICVPSLLLTRRANLLGWNAANSDFPSVAIRKSRVRYNTVNAILICEMLIVAAAACCGLLLLLLLLPPN